MGASALTFAPMGALDGAAERDLATIRRPRVDVADYAAAVAERRVGACAIRADGARVGTLIYGVELDADGRRVLVVRELAGRAPGVSLTEATDAAVDQLGARHECALARAATYRPGLVRRLKGWRRRADGARWWIEREIEA